MKVNTFSILSLFQQESRGRAKRLAVSDWQFATPHIDAELRMRLALAIGRWIGPKKIVRFSQGNVIATLLAAAAVKQELKCRPRSNRPSPPCYSCSCRSIKGSG